MAIRTYQSFSGYVASEPSTAPTRDGTPRFYARAGQRQGRREPDGTFTSLPTQYLPIVALGDAAEEAAALLSKGDNFTAEGRIRQVRYEKDGKTIEGEEFEVWKIGRRPGDAERTSLAGRELTAESPVREQGRSRDIPPEFAASRTTAQQSPTSSPAM